MARERRQNKVSAAGARDAMWTVATSGTRGMTAKIEPTQRPPWSNSGGHVQDDARKWRMIVKIQSAGRSTTSRG